MIVAILCIYLCLSHDIVYKPPCSYDQMLNIAANERGDAAMLVIL